VSRIPEPSLTEQRRAELEDAAIELLRMHGVEREPIPIEDILRRPVAELWQPDLTDLSLQSFNAGDRYAARPTIARLVARYVGGCQWARDRGLVGESGFTPEEMRYFGRALLMPKRWLITLSANERAPIGLRNRFHVPVWDAAERLAELFPPRFEPKPPA
jgi:hypothetical protein